MNADRPDPPYAAIPALWAGLTAEVQAELGLMVLEYAFADFLSGDSYSDHNRLCTVDIREVAADRRDDLLTLMCDRVGELLPELFGTGPDDEHPDGMDPPWAWLDQAQREVRPVARGRTGSLDQDQGSLIGDYTVRTYVGSRQGAASHHLPPPNLR